MYYGKRYVLFFNGECKVLIDADSIISKDKISKHVGVASWFHELLPASNTFVSKERHVWISVEGLPIKTWTHNMFAKIVAPWGKLSNVEADENLVYWLRVKELDAWAPDFSNDSNDSSMSDEDYEDNDVGRSGGKQGSACNFDNEEDEFVKDTEIDHVSESSCLNIKDDVSENHVSNAQNNNLKDPFGIYNLLNGSKDKEVSKSVDPIFPPGFTPDNIKETVLDNHLNHANVNVPGCNDGTSSVKSGSIGILKLSPGGSILEVMENLVKVGQTMRYNMEGCMKNMEAIIGSQGDFWASERRILWDYIRIMIESYEGESIILGDFNDVRLEQERFGTSFKALGANAFNSFISMAGLVDLPLDGYKYTWSHKSASKMSKLERFLISEVLKGAIKNWCKEDNKRSNGSIAAIKLRLADIDKILDHGNGSDDIVNERSLLLKELLDFNARLSLDMAQKAKIHWSIEGYENSKYFHGIINRKRSQLAIRGVLVEGDWIDEPSIMKNEFLSHFDERFSSPPTQRITLDAQFPNQISFEQHQDLERSVMYDEIKCAVWDCGSNKSPGPDGFTFDFYHRYWKLIDQYVVNAVSEYFSSGIFPLGCNSSFIAHISKMQDAKVIKDFRPISLIGSFYKIIAKILANRLRLVISDLISDVQSAFVANRQILDGPFIINELISWCKYKKTKAMIFTVDFEKAFDSVRWDYLDDILNKFGFGAKWRNWIHGCLNSVMRSILVNGSPTPEFKFHKGVKQGGPLSLFLFILLMESLHLSFKNILNAGLYKGIQVDESLTLSHLFYADDAVFIGKWDKSNINVIISVLNCFFLASGLKINLHKSKLMGINIPQEDVFMAANSIGCTTLTVPFNYHGVKVGVSSSRSCSWEDVLSKITARLSKWKLKTLSIGGRLTLLKSVLTSLPLYHMSVYKVPMGGLNRMESMRRNFFNGYHLHAFVKKKVGDGEQTLFWEDSWLSDPPLKNIFPRLYYLETNKHASVAAKFRDTSMSASFRRVLRGGLEEEQFQLLVDKVAPVILFSIKDRWVWTLDSGGEFSVKSARSYIDDYLLPIVGPPTRWVNVVPIKINIFAGRISLDRLPTRFNLSFRGIDVSSILCPICSSLERLLLTSFFHAMWLVSFCLKSLIDGSWIFRIFIRVWIGSLGFKFINFVPFSIQSSICLKHNLSLQPRGENDLGKLGTAPDLIVSDQSSNPTSSTNPNPKGRNRGRSKQRVENSNLEEHSYPVVTMADQHTMAQLLQAPTEGYEDAIDVPTITADNFELKHGLLTLV
nr:RNA-directed DNA polymerase, eukaryota [Tanacetum cinerariifolium]